MKHKRKLGLMLCMVLILSTVLMSLTGCGKDPVTEEPNETPDLKTYRIALFYANEEYVATGDETMEKFLVYEQELQSAPEDVYFGAVELLRATPEEGYATMLGDQIKLNQVYLEGDTAFVDFNSEGLSGGSLEEIFLISQVVNTLINSFEEVKQVQFLLDGQVPETLMGHVGTENPFVKDAFSGDGI